MIRRATIETKEARRLKLTSYKSNGRYMSPKFFMFKLNRTWGQEPLEQC